MDIAKQTQDESKAGKPKSGRFGVILFFLPVFALLAATLATTVAIAILVPDDSDYARASILKHERLAVDAPKKIVLVGGSNVSFGTDSKMIEKETGCPAVNMGMNGYFGVRFMMEEVKPYLKPGDIVVIAWEYDSFYKSVDGSDTNLLMVSKANPRVFEFLTPEQKVSALSRFPFVAQQKAIRVMGDVYDNFTYMLGAEPDAPWADIDILAVEGASNFTPEGDLAGHLGLTWPHEPEDGMDISNLAMDEEIVPLMQAFVREMDDRGVRVMISWTPLLDSFYERHKTEIERLNAQLATVPEFLIPRPAREFTFDKSMHFDTVYHLNEKGRAIRTAMLVEDITTQFGKAALCNIQQ
jgi:hypothetical protein